jgi:hypothetical protein
MAPIANRRTQFSDAELQWTVAPYEIDGPSGRGSRGAMAFGSAEPISPSGPNLSQPPLRVHVRWLDSYMPDSRPPGR